jgi:hypothetical protein
MSIWLEISTCADSSSMLQLDDRTIQGITVLVESMSAAHEANASSRRSRGWDYSSKVTEGEASQVMEVIAFSARTEDSRSVVLSANIGYRNSCYAVRLFFEKSQ